MRRLTFRHLLLVAAFLPVQSASAVPIDLTVIGIWSTNPGSAAPGSGTGLAKGQKFVVKTTYDPDVTPVTETTVNGFTYYSVDLAGGGAPPSGGGLVSNGNSLDVLIPLEGMDTGTPFIYASDEFSHGNFPGDPFPSPVPQVHFTDAAGTNVLGFKMESSSFGPGGNFVQMQTEIANIDPGDGIPVPTASGVAQIRTSSFGMVIRSINSYFDAVPVVAEAGADLAYSVGVQSVTTDGGTFRNGDGTWQDNDLGAARTDKEDFLTHDWRLLGSVEGGATDTALVGADADAERPNIIVAPPPSGTRTVEKVNKTVGIVNSGLRSTTDIATWQVGVSEDLTGFDGGTDIVMVSYTNDLTTIATALATPVIDDGILFELDVQDADLAINALGLVDFELVEVELLLDGAAFVGLLELIATGSQLVELPELLALFGPGSHVLEVRASDRVLRDGSSYVSELIAFEVVPEPGTGALLGLGLIVLGARRRQHRVEPMEEV
ncbi:MAG: PEP-CTERM sorting domain-containing protein [Deltaproteobacteria bacterium]|nr:PEP-CTERM sorting domain-containing protein [Deltaproteobacteria bacterium]MBW2421716.1 PEP-CTERM sorting domain-containing protein [Deltaproteobacteria bacterium]